MATKRELKKDIKYLTEQVIIDALEVSEMVKSEAEKEKVLKIIVDVAELHNSLISRVNHPDGKDNPKMVKVHFSKIMDDLMLACNKAYENLNKMVKA